MAHPSDWWRVCFVHGHDQTKFYRQLYGAASGGGGGRRRARAIAVEDKHRHYRCSLAMEDVQEG